MAILVVIRWLAFLGQTQYAHSGFSSLVQSLLPKDTLLRTYWREVDKSNIHMDFKRNWVILR